MTSSTRVDRLSISLGMVLAVSPLLPSGPRYLGFAEAHYSLVAFVALLVLWFVSWVREPSPSPALRGVGRATTWTWGAVLVAATGAAAVGLSRDNDVTSPVFWAYLRDLPAELGRPMDMVTHPMYPVSVWLVVVQGAVAFMVLRDICLRAPDPGRRARAALSGWLLGWVVVAAFAVVQYLTRFQLHPYWVQANPDLVRSHATLEDPNVLGAYLVLGLGIGVGLGACSSHRGGAATGALGADAKRSDADDADAKRSDADDADAKRSDADDIDQIHGSRGLHERFRWPWFLCALGVAALATTVSRSAWGGFFLALVLFAAVAPIRWFDSLHHARLLRTAARWILAGMLLIGTTSFVVRGAIEAEEMPYRPATPLAAVFDTLDPRISWDAVLTGRAAWWSAAAGMFAEHPFTGVGLGRFPRLVEAHVGAPPEPENAHSYPLQVLAEMGGLGFAAWGLLFGAVFTALCRGVSTASGRDRGLVLGALLGTSAFSLASLFSHPLLLGSGQLALATVLAPALVVGGSSLRQRPGSPGDDGAETGDEPTGAAWRRAAIAAALLVLLCYPWGALQQTTPPSKTSVWGYSWGLFPEEVSDASPFRWTGATALVDLDVPPGASRLVLDVAVPTPVRDGSPTTVRLQVGDHVETRELTTPDRVRIPIDLARTPQPPLRLRIDIEPTFVPAETDDSSDTRELGVQVFLPVFDRD